MIHPSCTRAGFTLVELLVAMAILVISLSIVTGALTTAATEVADPSGWSSRLMAARAQAIESGERTVLWPDSAHVLPPVLFLPDGRIVWLNGEPPTLQEGKP